MLRQAEAQDKNARLITAVRSLETILSAALERDARIAMDEPRGEPTPADLPAELRAPSAPDRERFAPASLGLLAGLLPGASSRRAAAAKASEVAFQGAVAQWERALARQAAALGRLKAEAETHNHEIEDRKSALKAGEPDAVRWYAEKVLLNSPYPDHFHKELAVGYLPQSRELAIELRVPAMPEIVPTVGRYKFDKTGDQMVGIRRAQADRAALYILTVSQMALRTLHEVFSTDLDRRIEAVKLQLYSVITDPTTGNTVKPSIIAVRVTRTQFDDVELARVEPIACLRRLMGEDGGKLPAWDGSASPIWADSPVPE